MAKAYLCVYNKPNLFKIGGYRFFPGLNRISEEQWDRMKAHPLLPARFDNGDLEFVSGKGPEDWNVDAKSAVAEGEASEDALEENPLLGIAAKKAIKLVSLTMNHHQLAGWKKTEKRKVVLEAINSQLKKVSPDNEETKESLGNDVEEGE